MTNREEVAKKLREAAEDIEEVSPYPAVALNKITNIIAINEITSYQDFFNRLADLIDPICHVALDEELSQELQGEMFRCSKCDAAFPRINGEYRYCPNCGARVVRE